MPRFPAPPVGGRAGPSTPMEMPGEQRSSEAPMIGVEYTSQRAFPASPFATATHPLAGAPSGEEERARKRTHYEAMDVDTPPRPGTLPPFPAEAQATTIPNPFRYTSSPIPPASASLPSPDHPLEFDQEQFSPKEAFGLTTAPDEEREEISKEIGKELDFVGGFRSEATGSAGSAGAAEPRRRRGARARDRSPERRRGGATNSDDEGDDRRSKSMLGSMSRKMGSSDFSFQVHHHHGASSATTGGGAFDLPHDERWLNKHTPYTLLGYLQFASLLFLLILALSLSLLFLYTLYTDIQSRLSHLTLELQSEILACAKSYVDNRCEPGSRLPAMEGKCRRWEECMGRDAHVVGGKTRIVAETVAEIVEGFVEVISWKTMLFVLGTLSVTVYGSSIALANRPTSSMSGTSHSPHLPPQPHFQNLGYHPQTYGYHPLPSPGYASHDGLGLGAPPQSAVPNEGQAPRKRNKGWLGL